MRHRGLRRLLAPLCLFAVLVPACYILGVPVASAVFRPPASGATPADRGLAYQERLFRGAGAQRLPAWVVPSGGPGESRGMAILLAENGGTRADPRMLWLASVVTEMGWDALLLDLRGHGVSSGVNTYGLGETRDLLSVLAVLESEESDRPLAAVGFSLGAACILRAMGASNALAAAVVFAPYARLDSALIRHELDYQTRGRAAAALLSRFVSARLVYLSLRLWAGFPSLPEPADLVTDQPVYLVHSRGDPEIPYENALEIVTHARAPNLALRTLERDAHLPPLSDTEVWEAVAGLVGEILR